jgi:hypothetical protein
MSEQWKDYERASYTPEGQRVVMSGGGSSATEVKQTDGTNIVNVLKSDGTAAGQNAELVAGTYLSVPFSTTIVEALATTDVGNYSHVSVQVTSHGTSSTVTFQCSDDGTNWFQNILENTTPLIAASSTVTGIYSGSLRGRYFRLNVTGISAGTTAGRVVFSSSPKPLTSMSAVQQGTWAVGSSSATGSAVPANAFYMAGISTATGNLTGLQTLENGANKLGTTVLATGLLAQVDDTSPVAITENQFGNVRMTADHSLLIAERSTTPTVTSVASSASSVSLLAANNARKGAVITNDSSVVLYIKLGTTASTSSYTVTLAGAASAPFSSYEVPFGYVGAIDGIWASATGNARITEIV